MRALDTNVLARFFVDDPDDAQAAKQRPARASGFATFDQRLAKRAKSVALTPPVELLV